MPYTREVWTLASRVKGELTEEHFKIKVILIIQENQNRPVFLFLILIFRKKKCGICVKEK